MFPNTYGTYVCVWPLAYRIGDDAMFFLLHKCTMLHPLQNGCFLQISGLLEMESVDVCSTVC